MSSFSEETKSPEAGVQDSILTKRCIFDAEGENQIINYYKLRMVVGLFALMALLFLSACGGGGSAEKKPVKTNPLTVSITGGGTVTSSPGGINCGTDCTQNYNKTDIVSLTAVANNGFTFNGWNGDCSGNLDCRFPMSSIRNVSAMFVQANHIGTFDLSVAVTGPGRVTSSPAGIDCGSACTQTYPGNTQVSLTAISDPGFVLDYWQGACSGNISCNVNMSSNQTVTAVFAAPRQTSILIENYSPPNGAFQLADIPKNASGITWHENIQQYLVVRNGSGRIYRYSPDFLFQGIIDVVGVDDDTEGLEYVADNFVMVISEDNRASKLEIDPFVTNVNGDIPNSQRYRLLPLEVKNKALEGIAVRPGTAGELNRVYAVQEGTVTNSLADMRVVYFDMPDPDPMVLLSYVNNLNVVEPFNAEQAFAGIVTDLAGVMYDQRTGHLIIVSEESSKAIQVDPETGAIISQLNITGAPQFEGVTLGPNGELVFVSEGNWIRIYTMN